MVPLLVRDSTLRVTDFSENFIAWVKTSPCMPGMAAARDLHRSAAGRPTQEHEMPNRGELPIPALRGKNAARRAVNNGAVQPDAEAWGIIVFCAIGLLTCLYMAVSSIGADAFPGLMAQIPLG
jgi:hypothetical protein